MSKLAEQDRFNGRKREGLTTQFQDIRQSNKDPKGVYVEAPSSKTFTDLNLIRASQERQTIVDRTASGIATSMELKKLKNIEERKLEQEEMSTIGLEVDLDAKPNTIKLLRKQRKQREQKTNLSKFGKQKLGVHG